MPKYKYLSASGVSVFANAVRFGLTCMSKIDGVYTVSVGYVQTTGCLSASYGQRSAVQLVIFYVLLVAYSVVFQL